MATKIYSSGNYLIIEFEGVPEPIQDSKSLVNVWLKDDALKLYRIESPKIGDRDVLLSEIIDVNGDPYDLNGWETFYKSCTGFNPASGGSEAFHEIFPLVTVWHVITLPSDMWCRWVSVLILSNANNRTVGVREKGSTLQRNVKIDADTTASFDVLVDCEGNIELYTTNTSVKFYITRK